MSENWPLHPVPWDDELLSEWIRRIAESYGISSRIFYQKVLYLSRDEITQIDRKPGDKALEILSKGTRQPIERLREMTLPARTRRRMVALEAGDPEMVRFMRRFKSLLPRS
ncbi:TniQ family protein [Oligoflexus sp.]|uniref:TniQ family protein n=1 Tax=Oligoflexus sp. TaxID=1971216 RepID=UPI0039C99D20